MRTLTELGTNLSCGAGPLVARAQIVGAQYRRRTVESICRPLLVLRQDQEPRRLIGEMELPPAGANGCSVALLNRAAQRALTSTERLA